MLYDKGKINGVLIVAPKGVVKTWYEQEIPAHMPDHVEHTDVLWQAMINKKQQKELDKLFVPGEDLHILVMNVEAFSTKKGVEFAAKFLRCHRTIMAIDESTTIKNPDAKRTRHICSLGNYALYRRILTGSPVTKSPLDLYKQCEFLKKELLGHVSYYSFRTRYAVVRTMHLPSHSTQIVVGYQNLGELSEKLKPFSHRVLKDDCLDLPEKTYIKRTVQLTPDQVKLYKQMKVLALAQMNGKMMSTATVLTQLMRLQQITCGHFTADDGSFQEVPSNRLPELMDVLEEIEGKVVIWAHWQRDVHRILREISKKFGENSFVDYYGLTPMADRQKNMTWRRDNNQKQG
jgi:SNF2 family DNA or RNA helicase